MSRRWPPGDVVAVAVLIALPVLVFGVPALLGHPVLPGDDMTQNFPLRVLAGQQIRGGQLPLYDPYIWSGAPLLGGWNAGAAYPLTLLFAIVPGTAAWTLNLIVAWVVAGAGMFMFLRALRLGSLPAFLGALSFAFAGAMAAQVSHFGLVAGMSWVPVQLLAVLRLCQDRGMASRLRWTAVLAGAAGLTILAGEPRAIDDACVVIFIYAAWQIVRLGRRRGPAVISVTAGAALGVCLGAVQWLPGLAAITTSQRAVGTAALFNSGSLPHKWLLLMLVPDLLGGSGSFGQPAYFAHYNLAEVTGYVGILPLVAAFALLGRLRLRPRPPEWLVVFTILGVVAVGSGLGSSVTAAASHGTGAASVSAPGRDRAPDPRPIAALGRPGRFAIYDPGEFGTRELPVLGSPDLNAISATPSVQGYSSIVDGRYAAATGSHLATGEGQDVLNPRAIGSGVLDQLSTTSLLTVPGYLITAGKRAWPAPGPPGTGDRQVAADQKGTWYFATQLDVSRLEVPDADARQDATTGTQIGLVRPGGSTRWFAADAASASLLAVHLRHPVVSVAMTGRAGGKPGLLGPPSIAEPGGRVYVADGQLQNALVPPRWGFAGHDGSFAVFVDRFAAGSLSLRALPGRQASGASVRRLAGPAAEPTAAGVSSPHGVRVVRAVAAIPGWSATWYPRGGRAVTLAVHRAGLVQAVDVPPGRGVVTWSYAPPGFRLGFALSLGAGLLVLLLLLAAPGAAGFRAYWQHARSPSPHRH